MSCRTATPGRYSSGRSPSRRDPAEDTRPGHRPSGHCPAVALAVGGAGEGTEAWPASAAWVLAGVTGATGAVLIILTSVPAARMPPMAAAAAASGLGRAGPTLNRPRAGCGEGRSSGQVCQRQLEPAVSG